MRERERERESERESEKVPIEEETSKKTGVQVLGANFKMAY
jgi:hypothetical protein